MSKKDTRRDAWDRDYLTKADWEEIEEDFLEYLRKDQIILMPAGGSTEELKPSMKVVWNLACKHNLRACGRLQVETWERTVGI